MKKTSLILSAALLALLTSCNGGKPSTANFATELDTLSYAIGIARTDGLDAFLQQQGVEEDQMPAFIKGFMAGTKKTEPSDVAYIVGLQVGQMVSKNWVTGLNKQIFGDEDTLSTISREYLILGFLDAVNGNNAEPFATQPEARAWSDKHMSDIHERMLAEKYAENKAAGERYLEENKVKEGVITTESGLQYRIIKEGKGDIPAKGDKVKVNYHGRLVDGTEFDSSKEDGPTTFRLTQVVKGWQEALQMMPVGSKWELVIPASLGYGSKENRGEIKPFSTLIFEVELVGIEPKAAKKNTAKKKSAKE